MLLGQFVPVSSIPALNSIINRSVQSVLFQGWGERQVLLRAEKGMQKETSGGFPSELNQHKKERKHNIIRGKAEEKSLPETQPLSSRRSSARRSQAKLGQRRWNFSRPGMFK